MQVMVLGAGVVGLTSAWYLRQAGFDVVVVDREQGPALSTSFANAGQISPGYASPWAAPGVPFKAFKWLFQAHAPLAIKLTADPAQYRWMMQMLKNCTSDRYAINKERMVRLAQYSRLCLDELRNTTHIEYEGRQLGTTQVFRTQAQVDAAAKDMAVLSEAGVPYELLDRAQIAQVEPGISPHAPLAGALRLPTDETGDCYLFCTRLEAMCRRAEVMFHYGAHIESVRHEQLRVTGVVINSVLHAADAYVLALGSDSAPLARPLGLPLPVYPLKGYSLTVPIQNADCAPRSTVLDETYKVAVTRFEHRIRIGGMAEIAGFNHGLNPHRRQTLEKVLTDLYPGGGDLDRASFWTGLRPATPDGTPIVGATPFSNLFTNTGQGTLGWTMACGSAQMLSDIISRRPPHIDTRGLDVFRYL